MLRSTNLCAPPASMGSARERKHHGISVVRYSRRNESKPCTNGRPNGGYYTIFNVHSNTVISVFYDDYYDYDTNNI